MMPLFLTSLVVIVIGTLALLRRVHLNTANARTLSAGSLPSAERYRPMLRLLNEEPVTASNRRAFRARRRTLFRGYLRCLTRDYAGLVAGLKLAMVESAVDRPDIAKAIGDSRMSFAIAMVRIEIGLIRHAAGIGTVDITGLVEALDRLRITVPQLTSPLMAH